MKKWFWGVLIGIDQLGNALLNGNPDETISSRIGRKKLAGKMGMGWAFIDWFLDKIDPGHSIDSIEWDEVPVLGHDGYVAAKVFQPKPKPKPKVEAKNGDG